ncbi:MAG: hypothetical protein BYD32DRAFT_418717 [Podila humilis]|nr:MAG: hypothetical protein BYD32DRAFT_418717 [Podila humilis]
MMRWLRSRSTSALIALMATVMVLSGKDDEMGLEQRQRSRATDGKELSCPSPERAALVTFLIPAVSGASRCVCSNWELGACERQILAVKPRKAY